MNLKNFKIDLPNGWHETSRMGQENQIYLNLNHFSPLAHLDPTLFRDKVISPPGAIVQVTKMATPIPSSGPIKASFDAIIQGLRVMGDIESAKKLEESYKTMSTSSLSERPEETDFGSNISIIQYQNAEIANQSFENMGLLPTAGLDMLVPGGVTVDGKKQDMTMVKFLESNIADGLVPKGELEKMRIAMKEAQTKMPEVKKAQEKMGNMFKEGKYLGHRVRYIENINTNIPAKPVSSANKKQSIGNYGNTGFLDPLPRDPVNNTGATMIYQSLLVGNYVISGSILGAISALPNGKKACYSLTKTKEVSDTSEGITCKFIVPLISNYETEGYLHKEEAEKILSNAIEELS